jgi:hypothetical protein
MKRIIVCILLIAACAQQARPSDNRLCLNLGWPPGIFAGLEHQFNHRIALKADIGYGFFVVLMADALFAVYFLPDTYRWQVGLGAGIPNAGVTLDFTGGMISLGGNVLTRFKASDKVNIDMRIGAGQPLFFEKDKEVIRDVKFPANLWPNFMLGVSIALGKRNTQ